MLRAASGAESGFRAGGPPADMFLGYDFNQQQRRVPASSTIRIFYEDGDRQDEFLVRFDPLRYVQSVISASVRFRMPTRNTRTDRFRRGRIRYSTRTTTNSGQSKAMAVRFSSPTVANLNAAVRVVSRQGRFLYGPLNINEILDRTIRPISPIWSPPVASVGWARGKGNSLGAIPLATTPPLLPGKKLEARVLRTGSKTRHASGERGDALSTEAKRGLVSIRGRRAKRGTLKPYFPETESVSFDAPQGSPQGGIGPRCDRTSAIRLIRFPYRRRPSTDLSSYHPGQLVHCVWLVEDQRFVDQLPTLLTWQRPTRLATTHLAGQLRRSFSHRLLALRFSAWIVSSIDVFPKGADDWKLPASNS